MNKEKGASMVEFAIIALVFFMLLFGIIEFARALFTYNTLVEATRRGARVAAVCPITDNAKTMVRQATIFNASPGTDLTNTTGGLLGLNTTDVDVKYFSQDLVTKAISEVTTSLAFDSDTYNIMKSVQVSIKSLGGVNNINLLIPGIAISLPIPAIQTTLPSESLGRVSSDNPITQRCCYGVCS